MLEAKISQLGNALKMTGLLFSSALSSAFNSIYPLVFLAMAFVILDCISAWRLSRRVMLEKCSKNGKTSCGKFKSHKMAATVFELIIIIPIGLMLAYWTQEYLFEGVNIRLPQIFAGIVIFWQLWSILENESSCNGAKWAIVLQKIMIDKTERHFDVDLSELRKEIERQTTVNQASINSPNSPQIAGNNNDVNYTAK